jgi:phage tail P2-like protein
MADQQLIPASISDDSTLAFNELIERMGTLDITPLLVYLVDDVPASVLPHLAEQFHITGYEGWLLASSDAERRALIKGSIELHRYKGTPYAVKKVLETLALSGTVQEWFHYGGQPYHFKIWVDIGERGMSAATVATLDALISIWKNTRSYLEVINLRLSVAAAVPVLGCTIQIGETITVDPWFTPLLEANGVAQWSAILQTVETITLNP